MCSSTFASLENEEEAWKLAKDLYSATHLGGQALWKLFRDHYDYKAGRRICLEVAQSCPQCQMGSDYGHRQETTGAIQSRGPWDTLSIDCGTSPRRPPPGVPHCVCGLLLEVYHPRPL